MLHVSKWGKKLTKFDGKGSENFCKGSGSQTIAGPSNQIFHDYKKYELKHEEDGVMINYVTF